MRKRESMYFTGDTTAKRRSYTALSFCIAFCYGLGLSLLPVDAFVDRDNYLNYAGFSLEIFFRYVDQSVWTVLFNEPGWLGINILLGGFFSVENVLRIIIFFSSAVTAFCALRCDTKYFVILVLILFLPQVIKNNIIHLRQGLAIAIFLCGWFSDRRNIRYALFTTACLIHSSFFIIMFLMIMNHSLVRLRLGAEIRAIVIFAGGVFIGLFGLLLASLLGARQAGMYAAGGMASVSGLAFAFWLVIAGLFAFQGRTFLRENSLQFSFIIFYLSTYFFLPVTARVFESGILLVLFSSLTLTSYRRHIFIAALLFYFVVQWASRLTLPWFGWGVENYI